MAMTTPVLADEITGNGNESQNTIVNKTETAVVTEQVNESAIITLVVAGASTGDVKANNNTGPGNVTADTGNATVKTTVMVEGSKNSADLGSPCGCLPTDEATDLISGNGNKSVNKIKNKTASAQVTGQGNATLVGTGVLTGATTGKVKTSNNTNGSVGVTTGNSLVKTNIFVGGSKNVLK